LLLWSLRTSPFFFQYIKLCSLYFLLSIFILAVVNDINSAKNKES